MLGACTASGVPAFQGGAAAVPAVSPDKDCGGVHINVKPCPVHLTRHTKAGIVVTVSGPHVVGSYLGHIASCFNGKICYNAERVGSSQTEWLITSGPSCGRADVEFDATNAHGKQVGYFFLKVSNKYCR